MVVTYASYDEAHDALRVGEIVAGAYHEESGDPVYFNVAENIPEIEMRMKAFEVRYGKPMDAYGKQVLEAAMERR